MRKLNLMSPEEAPRAPRSWGALRFGLSFVLWLTLLLLAISMFTG